ncbi:isoleucine--tRNA ligase [Candidatus Shapirobacteria bacterium CG09_land_8_20_14_0_10_47_13]|uniref:Isoleucine--tRNA ligase n=1 Tax=Candidatus Shapirobacteria bacterium CG09_land_8_20_14_0_10_47_13 TaxID=1974481 RepID=A0A2H0WMV0_9BACT|nr:MAG: isoleucine--tRNA ligase [Candidatus Shapirobacteria bacterium CG09_land_8_20_14_0_10_47_13]
MVFKPVEQKINFPEMEKRILAWWEKAGVVQKYLHKNDSSPKRFSFLDGPITANNPMGIHHAWGRTYKDLWQRYFNMKGYHQRFQNGFDNQGLWVEVNVEKELGFKDKKDIEKYGIEKFVNKCKETTLYFANIQTEQSKRLGYFMDWDHSYYTLADENNYMIWHFLKACHNHGWIYKGKDSVPWCPRCGTAISQHEILTEQYKEITHTAVFFKCLRLDVNYPSAFLVWTTTPWTVPADIALAVNPDFTYAEFAVAGEKETLIFLKDLGPKILAGKKWQIKKEFKGSTLAGEHYVAPFDDLPVNLAAKKNFPQTFHLVFMEKDLVTAQEGTGIVHIVPGAGTEDFQLGVREKLPVLEVIDEAANYVDGYGDLTGQNAKKQPELVFDRLKKIKTGQFLFKLKDYTHRYPQCWRCHTELVWRVVKEWYIKMDPLREPMKKVVDNIRWLPAWGRDQERDWLKNMRDWLISKKRYWGLALPIWECSCGNFEVIGSKEELQKRAAEGWDKFAGHTPHRPWIDAVKVKCPACGKLASRIPDVGNPWLDAGIVPFSTLVDPQTNKVSYLSDKRYWQEWFPADFITECFPGQFRNWFYSLLATSVILENTNPFKTLLGHAVVRDEKGEEMHKSKGNAIWFDEAAEKIGADVMRWLYVTQNPEINLNFGYHIADETRRRFHLLLWNIYNFFVTYANIDKFKVQSTKGRVKSQNILDQWIMSRLNQLVKAVTESLDHYDAYTASHAIEAFVGDLSTWYLRRSRDRVGPSVPAGPDKDACYKTLWEVLASLCQLLAPFTPFLAEEIYQNLTGEESVHLTNWPSFAKASEGQAHLISDMKLIREICEQGHAARKAEGIKVRQPLQKFSIFNFQFSINEALVQLIKEELNVKKVVFKPGKGEMSVELDVVLTPELIAEGTARELVRQIQGLRKKTGCRLDQKIKVAGPQWPRDEKLRDYLKKETLATDLLPGSELKLVV